MRMAQSLDDIEQAFAREIKLERNRRRSLISSTEHRSFMRDVDRRHKRGSMRFAMLVLTLVLTAVVVTTVMFRTLYVLLG